MTQVLVTFKRYQAPQFAYAGGLVAYAASDDLLRSATADVQHGDNEVCNVGRSRWDCLGLGSLDLVVLIPSLRSRRPLEALNIRVGELKDRAPITVIEGSSLQVKGCCKGGFNISKVAHRASDWWRGEACGHQWTINTHELSWVQLLAIDKVVHGTDAASVQAQTVDGAKRSVDSTGQVQGRDGGACTRLLEIAIVPVVVIEHLQREAGDLLDVAAPRHSRVARSALTAFERSASALSDESKAPERLQLTGTERIFKAPYTVYTGIWWHLSTESHVMIDLDIAV